jgi:hypothetical protein
MFISCTGFVLSGRDLCDGPIPHPEESYWLWRVSECDQVQKQTPGHLLWVGRGEEVRTTIRCCGNKEIYWRFKTYSIIPVLFFTKCCLSHNYLFSVEIIFMFFMNHA